MRFLGAFSITCLLALSSCELRPLVDPDDLTDVEIVLDTDGISNVTCDIYNPEIQTDTITSSMVRCLLYDTSSGKLSGQNFISEKSLDEKGHEVFRSQINLNIGTYHILAYNFDMPYTLIQDEVEFDRITAYTSEVPTALKSRFSGLLSRDDGAGPSVRYAPSHLMLARMTDLEIKPHTGIQTIHMEAKTIVDTYYLQIRVRNAQFVNSVSAVMTGLSKQKNLSTSQMDTQDPISIFFDMNVSTDPRIQDSESQEVIACVFNTFGKIDNAVSDVNITFNIQSKSGQVYEKTIPMDEVFKTENAIRHHWLLIDDEIVIPDPGPVPPDEKGSGFEPKIVDWNHKRDIITL